MTNRTSESTFLMVRKCPSPYLQGTMTRWKLFTHLVILCCAGHVAWSQVPFAMEGDVYAIMQMTPALMRLGVDPSNGAVRMEEINPDIGVSLDALGFSRHDRLLYGIDNTNRHLYRIDATGATEDLGDIGLDPNLTYRAGDVSTDGKTYYVVGALGTMDTRLYRINLTAPGYPSTQAILPGVTAFNDVAVDPTNPSRMLGFDGNFQNVVVINLNTFDLTGLTALLPTNRGASLYFDAFGTAYVLGTANGGVASALFRIDQQTGSETVVTTGPVFRILDLAGIPYSVEMQCVPEIRIGFPCNEIEYTVTVVNRTGEVHPGLVFETRIPAGFTFLGVTGNTIGGAGNFNNQTLRITGMQLGQSGGSVKYKVKIGNVPSDNYYMQSSLSNLPAQYGGMVRSDDPLTPFLEDSTRLKINETSADTTRLSLFLCLGDSAVLDGRPYGSQVQWENGFALPVRTVWEGGDYIMRIMGGCVSSAVVFHVTAATCPFTVEVDHTIDPAETLPCQEVMFRFDIENDSGTPRTNLTFSDTLPPGISFVEIVNNPFGGTLNTSVLPEIIELRNISVPLGRQSLDIRVLVGNIAPGRYQNQARLSNLPVELGPFRLSDDPRTPGLDSTDLTVLGTEKDTLVVDAIICEGDPLLLDGSPYGVDHHWFDGSTDSVLVVDAPGYYELVVFSGCEPSYVFFDVQAGEHIVVSFDSVRYHIRLGDSLLMTPRIENTGDLLDVYWAFPGDSSLSCVQCAEPFAKPYFPAMYRIYAENEHCIDSADVRIFVDNTRIIFVPNVFTPNSDGINDVLTIFSPDYGLVESFQVMDRAGSVLYTNAGFTVNDEFSGWQGKSRSKLAPTGTYVWTARIRFLDGLSETFAGTVTLIR